MQDVSKWLESPERDIDTGLILLKKYCRNKALVKNMSRRPRLSKIVYELEKKLSKKVNIVVVGDNTSHAIDALKMAQNASGMIGLLQAGAINMAKSDKLPVFNPANKVITVETADFKEGPEIIPFVVSGSESGPKPESEFKLKKAEYLKLPELLQEAWRDCRDMEKTISNLHALTVNEENQDKRAENLEAIEDYRKQIRKDFDYIDTWYTKQGEVRNLKKLTAKDIKNYRSYLTNGKKKISRGLRAIDRHKLLEEMQFRLNCLVLAGSPITDESKQEYKTIGLTL